MGRIEKLPYLVLALGVALFAVLVGLNLLTGDDDYFPLAIGARREYSLKYAAPFVGVQTGRFVVHVEGRETIAGKEYYRVRTTFYELPGFDSQVTYYRKAQDGRVSHR